MEVEVTLVFSADEDRKKVRKKARFDPDLAEVLYAIDRTGSMYQAHIETARSWSFVFDHIHHDFEAKSGCKLVRTVDGCDQHGSELTEDAHKLLELYERVKTAAEEAAGREEKHEDQEGEDL